jgi:hypothetical protein
LFLVVFLVLWTSRTVSSLLSLGSRIARAHDTFHWIDYKVWRCDQEPTPQCDCCCGLIGVVSIVSFVSCCFVLASWRMVGKKGRAHLDFAVLKNAPMTPMSRSVEQISRCKVGRAVILVWRSILRLPVEFTVVNQVRRASGRMPKIRSMSGTLLVSGLRRSVTRIVISNMYPCMILRRRLLSALRRHFHNFRSYRYRRVSTAVLHHHRRLSTFHEDLLRTSFTSLKCIASLGRFCALRLIRTTLDALARAQVSGWQEQVTYCYCAIVSDCESTLCTQYHILGDVL